MDEAEWREFKRRYEAAEAEEAIRRRQREIERSLKMPRGMTLDEMIAQSKLTPPAAPVAPM